MALLTVTVKPNAKRSALTQGEDGQWRAELKAQPVEGKANEALIALVAAHFKLRKSQVRLKRGNTSRLKTLELDSD